MNPVIQSAILTVGASWALSILVKATLCVTLGFGVASLSLRNRAAIRHAILAATFGILLALPLISALAPPFDIAVRDTPARPAGRPVSIAQLSTAGNVARSTPAASSRWSAAGWLLAAWFAGAFLSLVPAVIGVLQVNRLRRSGLPWRDGQSAAEELGVNRRVDVLLHDHLAAPMTCGILRPAIVLPVDATSWSREDLTRAIVHEAEHVARRDWITHCAARAICALYWFHPLVWIARRKLELEAERACDDAVLGHSEPAAYADQLIAVARRLSAAARPPALAMASRVDLSSRVRAVLDSRQPRGRAGALCVMLATAVAVTFAVALSPLRVVAAPQSAEPLANLRTETRLFVTNARVTFPGGAIVEGLAAADFEVTEDGIPQSIQICQFQKDSGEYVIGYYARGVPDQGRFRRVKITVKTATAAKVEHREGYYMLVTVPVTGPPPAQVAPRAYDTPPVLIRKTEPEYTEEARKAKFQGLVTLYLLVDENGLPTNFKIARSLGFGLDEKAIEAVKQWRFRPAMKNGKPIAAGIQAIVSFRLL